MYGLDIFIPKILEDVIDWKSGEMERDFNALGNTYIIYLFTSFILTQHYKYTTLSEDLIHDLAVIICWTS